MVDRKHKIPPRFVLGIYHYLVIKWLISPDVRGGGQLSSELQSLGHLSQVICLYCKDNCVQIIMCSTPVYHSGWVSSINGGH